MARTQRTMPKNICKMGPTSFWWARRSRAWWSCVLPSSPASALAKEIAGVLHLDAEGKSCSELSQATAER